MVGNSDLRIPSDKIRAEDSGKTPRHRTETGLPLLPTVYDGSLERSTRLKGGEVKAERPTLTLRLTVGFPLFLQISGLSSSWGRSRSRTGFPEVLQRVRDTAVRSTRVSFRRPSEPG